MMTNKFILLLLFIIGLSGCATPQQKMYKKLSKEDHNNTQYKGHFKVGAKYSINGKIYAPSQDSNYKEVGIASWYGTKNSFHGKKTANGDQYNKHMLSAAHTKLPLPCLVKITNLKNDKSLIVMVNDRGPFTKNRLIDVSEKAAEILKFKKEGTAKVKVEYLHQETQTFLKNIALNPKESSKSKGKLANSTCSVNCHIKLVNLKYQLAVAP